jgi:hypothetical protein
MKTFKFNNTEVSLIFTTYLSDGTLAVQMNSVPDEDSFGVITVNLSCPLQSDRLAFVDENNYPGIGVWLQTNGIASPLGYTQRSGFCTYELFKFNTAI